MIDKSGFDVESPTDRADVFSEAPLPEVGADVAVVCAYGLILPQAVLDACPKGCINVHASLLPRWRGAAPIQRAIMAGDKKSGVTIMQMDAGLDTGAMLMSESVDITQDMNAGQLHDKLSDLGAKLIVEVLEKMPQAVPQPTEGMTYASKITKEECLIDWTKPALQLHDFIRGLAPYPKAYFIYNGEPIKVLSSTVVPNSDITQSAGVVLDNNLTVACGSNTALRLECLQRAGKNPLEREDFLRGFKVLKGEHF